MKERLSLLCQNLDNVSERIIVQQAINLLRHYETRISGMEATVSNMCQEVAMVSFPKRKPDEVEPGSRIGNINVVSLRDCHRVTVVEGLYEHPGVLFSPLGSSTYV